MLPRTLTLFALPAMAFTLAACERRKPDPQPSDSATVAPLPSLAPTPASSPAPTPSAPPVPKLDTAALNDRKDPDRLLRFYAAALKARDWSAASRAWGAGSGVTAATLKAAYDRAEAPTLEVGKGEGDAGAGSQFYEAPVVLRFGAGPPERGTLSLRRVNDVPGATPEQLRWHIERATIGVGQ